MDVHVLNGDALAENFPFVGMQVVCRECFIEGPVVADNLDELWKLRAKFIAEAFDDEETAYYGFVKDEFEKLLAIEPEDDINLWFEHDLFCQTNLWFTLYYIQTNNLPNPLFISTPPAHGHDLWSGFGKMSANDLKTCFENRTKFSPKDIELGVSLWRAYAEYDIAKLLSLGQTKSNCFPLLKEVCIAHHDRVNPEIQRPFKKLAELRARGLDDFDSLFAEFMKTEGIYGFGDLQVKNMLTQI
jgi:hypothetical protein